MSRQRYQIVRVVSDRDDQFHLLRRRIAYRSHPMLGEHAQELCDLWNRKVGPTVDDFFVVLVEGGSPFRQFDLYRQTEVA
jgi:hypothetical protein